MKPHTLEVVFLRVAEIRENVTFNRPSWRALVTRLFLGGEGTIVLCGAESENLGEIVVMWSKIGRNRAFC